MKRKIVKHGDSTLTISLPSQWVKANSIKSGQYLNLKSSPQGLLISSDEMSPERLETEITGDQEWYVYRILRHLYTHGYDEIVIRYSTKEQLALIRKGLANLQGFEIVESKSDYCKIKCLTSLESEEYDNTVMRVMWLILSQFDHFIEDINKKKPVMNEEVKEIFKTTLKLNNLCRRLINKKPPYDSVTSKYAYRFLTSLLNISAFIVYSEDYLSKSNKIDLTVQEKELVVRTRDFYHELLNAYQNINVQKTKNFFDKREEMFDSVLEILRDKNPVITHYFLDILKELSSIGNLILVLKLNEESEDGKSS
ncbi:MAG: hypothetical protein KKE23_03790, partial [Nanoarchaeota archaeon]|nr:hypothetical protein [Nanoarchaeota archaeon]